MQLIPVIDLKQGQVVHAVRGNRNAYQPIHQHSRLTDSSDIEAVLEGFLSLHTFKRFYLADLDAICGNGNHEPLLRGLLGRFPDLEFWIDDGGQLSDMAPLASNHISVFGTESQRHPLRASSRPFILSLDYKNDALDDAANWFQASELWPQTVIAMTLNRVGSSSGPDVDRLRRLRRLHPDKQWIAAGGIRSINDLNLLRSVGTHASLVATALHDGSLSATDIANLQAKKYPGKPGYFAQP